MGIYYQFLLPDTFDYHIKIPWTEDHSISCSDMLAASSQILMIFFLKQAVNAIWSKDRCFTIVYMPWIRWIKDTEFEKIKSDTMVIKDEIKTTTESVDVEEETEDN